MGLDSIMSMKEYFTQNKNFSDFALKESNANIWDEIPIISSDASCDYTHSRSLFSPFGPDRHDDFFQPRLVSAKSATQTSPVHHFFIILPILVPQQYYPTSTPILCLLCFTMP